MPRRTVKQAPNWFPRLLRFLVLVPFPLLLVLGPAVPRSILGLPLTVTGRVAGVTGARVYVHGDPVRFETTTDQDGVFRFSLPSLGSGQEPESAWREGYRIGVTAAGRLGERDAAHLPYPVPDAYPIDVGSIHLRFIEAEVSGRVTDLEGRPVPHARVRCDGGDCVADSAGRFGPLGVAAGYREVAARAPGLTGAVTALVFPGQKTPQLLEIPVGPPEEEHPDGSAGTGPARGGAPGVEVRGRVRDELTGWPLPDVLLSPFNVFTDEWGRFVASVPAREGPWFYCTLHKAGYEIVHRAGIRLDGANELRMTPMASVRVRILDADGEPAVGASVDLNSTEYATRTDQSGVARAWVHPHSGLAGWAGHRGGSVRLFPREDGLRALIDKALALVGLGPAAPATPKGWEAEAGDHLDLGTFTLESSPGFKWRTLPGSFSRIVDPGGQPVPWPISLRGTTLKSTGSEAGELVPRGHLLTAAGFECLIVEPLFPDEGPITLRPARPIRGRLLTLTGLPVAGVEIQAGAAVGESMVCPPPMFTDRLGRFVILGVPDGVEVELVVPLGGEGHALGRVRGGTAEVEFRAAPD